MVDEEGELGKCQSSICSASPPVCLRSGPQTFPLDCFFLRPPSGYRKCPDFCLPHLPPGAVAQGRARLAAETQRPLRVSHLPQTSPTSSVAVAGAVIGAVLALFLIAVFTIVLLAPRDGRPPAYTDKVIDLPPSHKPPPPYTERTVALPLAVNPAHVHYSSQARRGARPNGMVADSGNASARRAECAHPPGPTHEPLSYQEWICHLHGADRVHVNHRQHYV
ncbi:hypothetical protein AAFF_G00079180 [Aldrovandia affinis]|uniref:Uncharacterized protein n=1 Tax=Aldrovandia affinis TaxID=143900 RepID=A0AAD7WCL3_9TELE|nr:hypothetical protein AAFF_G00079180 [Aldrovandia affinis]